MVTKIIACSDIHIPSLKGIDELKETLTVFIDKCKKIVKDEDGPENVRIVVAGDIFHNKLAITNESILCAHWFFSELDKICKTFIVIGNHDFLMNNTGRVDSLSPLFEIGSYKQVYFLDKELGLQSGIYKDDNIAWCLYSSFTGFNTPEIEMFREADSGTSNPANVYVGVIHGDVNGAITTTNRVTENGLEPGVFDGCDFVIASLLWKTSPATTILTFSGPSSSLTIFLHFSIKTVSVSFNSSIPFNEGICISEHAIIFVTIC